ncbi:hypothetical protein [Leucobacter aridicollis]|uniref:Uncharacterized protein n=1 Tax=Leucobacter aridicollis TaxID=283878 RepID=A0A852QX52_9MICO|nr:hypothetical protein [Leucobacter aridicollis]MBL3682000.1 hypothetical protein [Leucobacter aridicollis]NYD26953.1 hypothetical protein [Leucobacter aridicollis]
MREQLDFVETTVERRSFSRSKVLITVALSVAAILALIGAGSLAWNFVVYQPTDRGSCLSFNSHDCKSLTRAAIEDMGQVSLPEDARVLRSGSGKTLKSASSYAVVELPGDSELILNSNYRETKSDGTAPAYVRDAGLVSVDTAAAFTESSNVIRKVFVGSGEGGERLAYIEEWRDF